MKKTLICIAFHHQLSELGMNISIKRSLDNYRSMKWNILRVDTVKAFYFSHWLCRLRHFFIYGLDKKYFYSTDRWIGCISFTLFFSSIKQTFDIMHAIWRWKPNGQPYVKSKQLDLSEKIDKKSMYIFLYMETNILVIWWISEATVYTRIK